jgi:DNA ligase-1
LVVSGNEVAVGSGFTMEQRRAFKEKPDLIVGKVVTVQYFEETATEGAPSLRFPLLKIIHGDKRIV